MKRPFLLLETVVAIGLSTLLFSLLLQSAIQFFHIDKRLAKREEILREEALFQVRIETLFSKKKSSFTPSRGPLFSVEKMVDPDPSFSGTLIAHVTHEDGSLFLTLYSSEEGEKRSFRKEALLHHIASFSFEESASSLAISCVKEDGSPLEYAFYQGGVIR